MRTLDEILRTELYTNISALIYKIQNDYEFYESLECDEKNLSFINEEGEEEFAEPLEYYAISEWLFEQLVEIGQYVFKLEDLYVWGRCCYGQAISMDSFWEKLLQNAENRLADLCF